MLIVELLFGTVTGLPPKVKRDVPVLYHVSISRRWKSVHRIDLGHSSKCRTYCICRRIVKAKSTQKYTTRIGQNTGTSNASESVERKAITVARVAESLRRGQDRYRHRIHKRVTYQKFHSGRRRTNGGTRRPVWKGGGVPLPLLLLFRHP
jgi:hypothetical protein